MNIPGYSIEQEIGRGGMATVYQAVQESLHRSVALKVMAPALAADADFGERFLREARTAAGLTHTGILSVYDVGVVGHHYYLAMEYLPGGDLKQRLSGGLLLPQESLAIIRQLALALGYAHNRDVVHRDVKPENILFREDGTPVLADFGIAKALGSGTRMTGTGMSIGTPRYMSPEQARGKTVDGRADLYSLGIMLFEMLTGRLPYDGEDAFSIGIAHISEPLPQLPVSLGKLQPLLDQLLAKDPAQRFATAAELIIAIDTLLSGGELPYDAVQSQPSAPKPAFTQVVMAAPQPKRRVSPLIWLLCCGLLAALLFGGYFYVEQQSSTQIARQTEAERQQQVAEQQRREQESESERQRQLAEQQRRADEARRTAKLQERNQVRELLISAESDLAALRLTRPDGNNAFEKYQKVLSLDADNSTAKEGLEQIIDRYIELSDRALAENDFAKARGYFDTADGVIAGHVTVAAQRNKVATAEDEWQGQLTRQNTRYTDNDNGTITDTSTGLVWQHWYTSLDLLNWQESINYCNRLDLGGSNRWRLPEIDELESIIDISRSPSVDPMFIHTSPSFYWSASSRTGFPSLAWGVDFGSGRVSYSLKQTIHSYVRCVQDTRDLTGQQHQQKINRQAEAERKFELAAQRGRYLDNGNGTVTDTSTKMIWQQRDDGNRRRWQVAINYCNDLNLGGSSNWRLPTMDELESLIDKSRNPTIDLLFDGTKTSFYWSASSEAYDTDSAWSVYFSNDYAYISFSKTSSKYVRCVR